MLEFEPDIWYDRTRRKYVLVFTETDSGGVKRRKRISTGTDSKQDAKLFRLQWMQDRAVTNSSVSLTVKDALAEAFRSKKDTQSLRPSSCKELERSMRYFVEFANKNGKGGLIHGVTFHLIDSFLRSIPSARQRVKHRANLSALWNTLLDFRETYGITDNPWERAKKPKLPESSPEQMTESEFNYWLEKAPQQTFTQQMHRLASAFSYYAGLREVEVCHLPLRNTIGPDIQVLNLPGLPLKDKQNRFVPATSKAREILQTALNLKIRNGLTDCPWTFCNFKGEPLSRHSLSKYFTEARRSILPERTGVTFHALRRSFGQNLLNNGMDIADVSRLLGHSSISVTEKHYANAQKMSNDRIRELMDRSQSQQVRLTA